MGGMTDPNGRMTDMDIRDDIAKVVDEWSTQELRETFLAERLHQLARRRLIDRIERMLRDKGVSTVPQTTPKVPPRIKEALAPIVEKIEAAIEGASTGATTAPPAAPVDADDAAAMDALKGKLKGVVKGKKGARK